MKRLPAPPLWLVLSTWVLIIITLTDDSTTLAWRVINVVMFFLVTEMLVRYLGLGQGITIRLTREEKQ